MAGAPLGNRNAQKGRDWEAALRRAINKHSSGMALAQIAEKVVEQALNGEWRAIEEIANRLDGKPAQSIEHSGDFEHRHYSEMTEEMLERIATAGSDGATEQTSRPPLDS